MPFRILIDGYNVIHALPSLQAVASTSIESARDSLTEMAAALIKPGTEVLLVFDGQGLATDVAPALPGIDGLIAVYTARNLSADSWIERTVYKTSPRNLCTVVTADGGIRDLCRGLGARVFTPDWFDSEIRQHRAARTGGRERGRTSHEPGDQFDSASRERLSKLRDELNDRDGKS